MLLWLIDENPSSFFGHAPCDCIDHGNKIVDTLFIVVIRRKWNSSIIRRINDEWDVNKFVTILKKSQSFVPILLCHCFWHHHRYQNCDDVIDNLSRTANRLIVIVALLLLLLLVLLVVIVLKVEAMAEIIVTVESDNPHHHQ